jgi:hypothetical protein
MIAVGFADGIIEVIEPTTQRRFFSTKNHENFVRSLAWSPDEKRLVSSSRDGAVKVTSATSGQSLLTLHGRDQQSACVAWSDDGNKIAAAREDGTVEVWDATRGYDLTANPKRRGEMAWAYYDLAKSTSDGDFEPALRACLRYAPDNANFWPLRGRVNAILGDYDIGANEFAKLSAPDVRHSIPSTINWAACLMAAGDVASYQRVCAALVAAYEDSPSQAYRHVVIERCATTPDSAIDPAVLVKMAKDERDSKDLFFTGSREYYLALASLRDGQYQDAARLLTEILNNSSPPGDDDQRFQRARQLYVCAIARHAMGHQKQGRRLFAEAELTAGEIASLKWNWRFRVDLEVLRREALAAVGGP